MWHCRQTAQDWACGKNPCCHWDHSSSKCKAKNNHEAMHRYGLGQCNAGHYLKAMDDACEKSCDHTCCSKSGGKCSFMPESFGARCSLGAGMKSGSELPNPNVCGGYTSTKTCATDSSCEWKGEQSTGKCQAKGSGGGGGFNPGYEFKEYKGTGTGGAHCGGTSLTLADGTKYGDHDSADHCKAKCGADKRCDAFVWRDDGVCYWKTEVFEDTIDQEYEHKWHKHSCYLKVTSRGGGGGGGFNPGDQCKSHTSTKTCGADTNCVWKGDQSTGSCMQNGSGGGGGFNPGNQCSTHTSTKTCGADTNCVWKGDQSTGSCMQNGGGGGGFNPGGPKCDTHTSSKTCDLDDDCQWAGTQTGGKCKDKSEMCPTHTSEKTCGMDSHCQWTGPQSSGNCVARPPVGGQGRSSEPAPNDNSNYEEDGKLVWSTKRAPFDSTFHLDLGESDNREMQIEQVNALLDVKMRHPNAEQMMGHMMKNHCTGFNMFQCPFQPCCEVKFGKCNSRSFWDVSHKYDLGVCNAGVWLEGLHNWCAKSCDSNCCGKMGGGKCGFSLEGVSSKCPAMDAPGRRLEM